MSNDPAPNPNPTTPPPLNQWLNRLGLSGKLLVGGGLGGLISAFLPVISMSGKMGGISMGGTAMVVDGWMGKIGLICSAAAILLAWLLYQGKALNKNLIWGAVGVGAVGSIAAIWLLIDVMRSGSGFSFEGMGVRVSPGIGAFTNVAAGIAMAAGSFLKAREEKLL